MNVPSNKSQTMLGGSKTPLKVKENESSCPEQKEEASFPPRDPKSCKVAKSKVIKPSKKENFTLGKQTQRPKRALKSPQENWCHPQGAAGSRFGVLTEPPFPLHTEEDFSSSQAVPLGNCFSPPGRAQLEGKPDLGLSEERKTPAGFAAVMTAEFGLAQESFGKQPTGTSPTSLKLRRRSTIGLRGSPENNTLIRYLAQQRSSRQKEAFTQISPFKPENVRSLKCKIDAFQASFESLQEAEGEPGLPHLEEGSSQKKAPVTKEPNLDPWSEKFTLGNRGAALKEDLSENGTKSRSELRICSIVSPQRAERVYEQQNPIKSLETVVTGDTLETGHAARCAHSSSAAACQPSTRRAGLVEEESLGAPGNAASTDLSLSSSLLRSILKKTPGRELPDSPREYSNSATEGGRDESAAVSNCVKAFETLQTERTDTQTSKTPKKKKVTFGEVLSPEIFDQSLPANTPLRRGASPGCPQGQSPWARPGPSEEPLPLLDFGCHDDDDDDDEGVEPLPEFLEGSVAAEAPPPVENAEVAETDKPDMITACYSERKHCRAVAEDTAPSSSGATEAEDDKDAQNPRRSKIQRQRNPTTAAPKKTQKRKYPCFGKRRKKKVKKSLYGEREMASKKPLLSPIPEIPEVFSSVSSPNSPKEDPLFTEGAGLGEPSSRGACGAPPQAGRMLWAAAVCPSPGDSALPGSLDSAPEFSNTVPDAEGDIDTSECFQQDEETLCEREAKESSSLIEKEELQGNLLRGLEILERQDLQEGAQRTGCPQKDSVRARRRRRSSSAFYFPPVENVEVTGADLAVPSYNVEEVFPVPPPKEGSRQACGRRSSAGAEGRVRRSMRLRKDSASEGLAWIQLPGEIPKQPPLLPAPKARRSISTSILTGSENIHHREQNFLPFPAPGKENEGSAPLAAAPARRWRRRSLCEAPAREMPWAPTQRRRSTNSGCGKDRSNQKPLEAAETLEQRLRDVPGISDFLK